jgi:Spy/CpxP family protein refolding chaperone
MKAMIPSLVVVIRLLGATVFAADAKGETGTVQGWCLLRTQTKKAGKDRIMKTKVIVAWLLSSVTASQPAFTVVQRNPTDDEPPHVTIAGASTDKAYIPADLLATAAVMPRGPRDLLRDYELEMASIAGQLSMDLGAISNAVGTTQITREQGEYVSGEVFQVAMMRFQLLGALHAMLEADIARTPAVRTDPTPPPAGETVLVAMPFSSFPLSPSMVEYLGLTSTQAKAIQKLMDQERPTTEPLIHELRTVGGELCAAIQQSQNHQNEGTAQRLAARQARLLKQLMRANFRLQRRINDVLDSQQRKKLDSFKRTSEVMVGEGN